MTSEGGAGGGGENSTRLAGEGESMSRCTLAGWEGERAPSRASWAAACASRVAVNKPITTFTLSCEIAFPKYEQELDVEMELEEQEEQEEQEDQAVRRGARSERAADWERGEGRASNRSGGRHGRWQSRDTHASTEEPRMYGSASNSRSHTGAAAEERGGEEEEEEEEEGEERKAGGMARVELQLLFARMPASLNTFNKGPNGPSPEEGSFSLSTTAAIFLFGFSTFPNSSVFLN